MINLREIIRRLFKYLILVLISGLTLFTVSENRLTNKEIFYTILIIGLTFCILDIVTPSIHITIN